MKALLEDIRVIRVERESAEEEPQRKGAQEFVEAQRQYYERGIEHFRREIPDGRTIVFTNADHICFIDREPEVLREVRAFLAR